MSDEVLRYRSKVLRFSVENMPYLKAIACLGKDSWEGVGQALGVAVSKDWSRDEYGHRDVHVADREVRLFALPHPTQWPGGRIRVEAGWRRVGEYIGRSRE